MKKSLITLTTLTVLAVAAAAWAGPGRGGRGKGNRGMGDTGRLMQCLVKNQDLATEAGITSEQIEQVREIIYAGRKESIPLKADEELARLEYDRLLDQDTPDQEAVFKALDALGQARTALQKERVKSALAVRAVIGSEKIAKLRELVRERGRDRRQARGDKSGKRWKGHGGGREGGPWMGPGEGGPPWMQDTMPPPDDDDSDEK